MHDDNLRHQLASLADIYRSEAGSSVRILGRRSSGGLTPSQYGASGSVPPADVSRLAPSLVGQEDVYFTINSFYRTGTHATQDLRDLYAVWVEVDWHGRDIAVGAVDRCRQIFISRNLPGPSLTVSSGRGYWFIWFISDPRGGPVRAFPNMQRRVSMLNERLVRLLRSEGLPADASSTALNRALRFPKSVNSKASTEVEYRFNLDDAGMVTRFELNTFDAFLEGEREVAVAGRSPRRKTASSSNISRNMTARAEGIVRLNDRRGGFSEGVRNEALFILGHTYRAIGVPRQEIADRLRSLNRTFHPPLTEDELGPIIRGLAGKGYKFYSATVGERLRVNASEVAELLLPFLPRGVPRSRRPRVKTQQIAAAIRDQMPLVDGWSVRGLREWASGLGFDASVSTIHAAVRICGLEYDARARKWRRPDT